jgi:hypothetical protein
LALFKDGVGSVQDLVRIMCANGTKLRGHCSTVRVSGRVVFEDVAGYPLY